MSEQWVDGKGLTFTAGEDLTAYDCVYLSAAKTVMQTDDSTQEAIGFTRDPVASGDPVTVIMRNKQGSCVARAGGVIAVNALVYPGAGGEVFSNKGTGSAVGVALQAAAAADDLIEIVPLPLVAAGSAILTDPGDAGAIPVDEPSGHVALVSAGAETRTVADATKAGQELLLYFKTDGGDCVVTFASPVNQTGNNTATFADAGDFMLLRSIEDGADFEWREIANDGALLSTV